MGGVRGGGGGARPPGSGCGRERVFRGVFVCVRVWCVLCVSVSGAYIHTYVRTYVRTYTYIYIHTHVGQKTASL
jgi:hypothetical protein